MKLGLWPQCLAINGWVAYRNEATTIYAFVNQLLISDIEDLCLPIDVQNRFRTNWIIMYISLSFSQDFLWSITTICD